MRNTSNQERMMVDWAAPTLTRMGCTLHAHPDGWDIEMPDGSWQTANSPRELVTVATLARSVRS